MSIHKGGVPLRSEGVLAPFLKDREAPEGINFSPGEESAPILPTMKVAADGTRREGPLGAKSISPEAFAQALRTAETISQQGVADAVVRPEPSVPGSPLGPQTEPQARAQVGPPQSPPASAEKKEDNRPDIGALSLMGIAQSGLEHRVNPALLRDPEYMQTILWKASGARKKWIEEHCGPIDKDALFTAGDIQQDILLWTKPRVGVRFRTLTGDDEYWLRRTLRERYGESDSELELGFVVVVVAGGVVEFGPAGQRARWPEIPSPYISDARKRKREVLDDRINRALALPYALLTDLAINYAWFIERVQREQKEMDLGNG